MTTKLVKSVNEEEVIERVKDYVSNVFGVLFGFFISKIEKNGELWIVEGRIYSNVFGAAGIVEHLSAIAEDALRKIETVKIVEEIVSKKSISASFTCAIFCFYVNHYGKICASCIKNIKIDDKTFFETEHIDKTFSRFNEYYRTALMSYWKEIREKDIKDYCMKAKNFIEKGTTFRSFDFIPFYAWCVSKNKAIVFSLVVLYSLTRTIFISCIIEVTDDKIDLQMIGEPVEI